jgi:hypothetical protein
MEHEAHVCPLCGAELVGFVEHAAPGRGASADCSNCGEQFVVIGRSVIALDDVDPSSLELDPSDVI